MTKENLKQYIIEVIDSLEEEEVQEIFSSWEKEENELINFSKELIKTAGEIKKLTKVVQNLQENSKKDLEVQNYLQMYNFLQNSKEALLSFPKISIFNIAKFSESFGEFKNGFLSIESIFEAILQEIELFPTAKKGEIFNPLYHEAIQSVSFEDKKDKEIIEVFEQGFIYKNSIIRTAKVKVNKWIS